jgi:hypothetical protein
MESWFWFACFGSGKVANRRPLAAIQIAQESRYKIARGSARRAKKEVNILGNADISKNLLEVKISDSWGFQYTDIQRIISIIQKSNPLFWNFLNPGTLNVYFENVEYIHIKNYVDQIIEYLVGIKEKLEHTQISYKVGTFFIDIANQYGMCIGSIDKKPIKIITVFDQKN